MLVFDVFTKPEHVRNTIAPFGHALKSPGKPVAHGVDLLTIRDGRVSVVRTLIAPDA